MTMNVNIIDGGQAAAILYRFLSEAGLITDNQETLTRWDELLP